MSKCAHDWRPMTWEEAYPASSGKLCTKCKATRLGWLCDINEPGGEETAAKIVSALSGKGGK